MCRCPDLETFRRGTPALSVEDNFFSERVFAVVRPCTGWRHAVCVRGCSHHCSAASLIVIARV